MQLLNDARRLLQWGTDLTAAGLAQSTPWQCVLRWRNCRREIFSANIKSKKNWLTWQTHPSVDWSRVVSRCSLIRKVQQNFWEKSKWLGGKKRSHCRNGFTRTWERIRLINETIITVERHLSTQNGRWLNDWLKNVLISLQRVYRVQKPASVFSRSRNYGNRKESLHFVTPGGKFGVKYNHREVLQKVVKPWAEGFFGSLHLTFQQDSAPLTGQRAYEANFQGIIKPFCTPDLSPMDFSISDVFESIACSKPHKFVWALKLPAQSMSQKFLTNMCEKQHGILGSFWRLSWQLMTVILKASLQKEGCSATNNQWKYAVVCLQFWRKIHEKKCPRTFGAPTISLSVAWINSEQLFIPVKLYFFEIMEVMTLRPC